MSSNIKKIARNRFWAIFFFLLPLCSFVHTYAWTDEYQQKIITDVLTLSQDPTWRRLLHIRKGKQDSDLLSSSFFISSDSNNLAFDELNATIHAFKAPTTSESDPIQCRYPARFIWLKQYFAFDRDLKSCTQLNAWAKIDQMKSISLVLVSGYFGNPASTFGHVLLKLNNQEYPSQLGLLDLGVNYGALVPANELTAIYVMKGLFGGYEAGFSDKNYYNHDQIYSETEYRDMWEYPLRLSEFEKQFITYHLWEITSRKFQYFFLKENCAFRLAELLELVHDEDFTSSSSAWYSPVEIFHRLKDLENKSGQPVFETPRFIPSRERLLYGSLKQLEKTELSDALNYIKNQSQAPMSARPLSTPTINALLEYYQFKIAGRDDATTSLKSSQHILLAERLRRPVESVSLTKIDGIGAEKSPADSEKPSFIGIGVLHSTETESALLLQYGGFNYDEIGDNTLHGSSLVVLDLEVGKSPNYGTFINKFDFVKASKNRLYPILIPGESIWSWDLGFGIRQHSLGCLDCETLYGNYAFGRTYQLPSQGIFEAKLSTEYEHYLDSFIARPNLGFLYWIQDKTAIKITVEHIIGGVDNRLTVTHIGARHSLTKDWQLKGGIGVTTGEYESYRADISLSYRYY